MEVGRFCGELTGEEAVVGGSQALLTFYSNGWKEKRGFFLNFTFSEPCKCSNRTASCCGGLRYANQCHSLGCKGNLRLRNRDLAARYENDILALLPKCPLETHSLALIL